MNDKRGFGKTVLGWFVVQDGSSPEAAAQDPVTAADAADELIARYARNPPPPPPLDMKGPLPAVTGEGVDFAAVYEAAGVEASARDRVKKAQDLLRALPADTPLAVKRQIVEASLRAFGIPTEQIIEAGVQSIEALESFIRHGQAETQQTLTEASERIAALEKEITAIREVMQSAVTEQESRERRANREKLTVQEVLEFFGEEAVAQVVKASPKLHSP